ncbi:MAG TPA: flagellar export protein FliJ [Steroidobacteraceae bacterium]
MLKSKRFQPIQEIASTSAQDLSRVMGEAGRKVTDLERQLEQLQNYRDEYVRNSTQSNGAMDAVKLQNYRSFLGRLGEALSQHMKSLDGARGEFEKRRAQWSEKRIEAESLSRVVDRFRKEEQHAADRREQRDGDDAAMRSSLAARSGTGNA